MSRQHEISKSSLSETRWVDLPTRPLEEGEVRLAIDDFALTANNVTYASFGGAPMHYYAFFPSSDGDWGRVPVWGFATITESRAEGVSEGRRVYGYFPIADELIIEAARVTPESMMDGAAHRAELAPIYSTYIFTDTDPAYVNDREAEQMLFRPLYATGWWLADTLTVASNTPLSTVISSSASSKTALAMAHVLASRGGVQLIGLTSEANADYVRGTGLYAETVTYEGLDALKAAPAPAAYVDFRGVPALTHDVHAMVGDGLVRSLVVGATQWDADRTPTAAPGPAPEFFFVPDVAAARIKDAGPGLMADMASDMVAFYAASSSLCQPIRAAGTDAIDAAWAKAVAGKVPANEGLVLTLER